VTDDNNRLNSNINQNQINSIRLILLNM